MHLIRKKNRGINGLLNLAEGGMKKVREYRDTQIGKGGKKNGGEGAHFHTFKIMKEAYLYYVLCQNCIVLGRGV